MSHEDYQALNFEMNNYDHSSFLNYKKIELDSNGDIKWESNEESVAPPKVENPPAPKQPESNNEWNETIDKQLKALMTTNVPRQDQFERLNLQLGVQPLPDSFKTNTSKEVHIQFEHQYPNSMIPVVFTTVYAPGTSPDAVYTSTISSIDNKGFKAIIQLLTTHKCEFEDDIKLVWRSQAPSDMAKVETIGSLERLSEKDAHYKIHNVVIDAKNVSSSTHAVYIQPYSMSDLSFVTTVFESKGVVKDYDNSILNVYVERISDSHKHWNVDLKLAYMVVPLYDDVYGPNESNSIGSNEISVPTVVKKINSSNSMLFDMNALLLSPIVIGNPFGMACNLRRIDSERGHIIFATQKYVEKQKHCGWNEDIVISSLVNCEPCVAPEMDVISEVSNSTSLRGDSAFNSLTSYTSDVDYTLSLDSTTSQSTSINSNNSFSQQQQPPQPPLRQNPPPQQQQSYQNHYQHQQPQYHQQPLPPQYQQQQPSSHQQYHPPSQYHHQQQPPPPPYQHQQYQQQFQQSKQLYQQRIQQQQPSGTFYPSVSSYSAPSPYQPGNPQQPQQQQQQFQQQQTMKMFKDFSSMYSYLHTIAADQRFHVISRSIDFLYISLSEATTLFGLMPSESDYRKLFDRICHRIKNPPAIADLIECLRRFSGEHDRVHVIEFFYKSSPPPPSHKMLSAEVSAYLSTLILPSSKLYVLEFLVGRIKDKKKAVGIVEQFENKDKKKAKKLLNWWF